MPTRFQDKVTHYLGYCIANPILAIHDRWHHRNPYKQVTKPPRRRHLQTIVLNPITTVPTSDPTSLPPHLPPVELAPATNPQPSSFFTLPLELRLQIYTLTLTSQPTLYLRGNLHSHIRHVLCYCCQPTPQGTAPHPITLLASRHPQPEPWTYQPATPAPRRPHHLALLRSCRQVHTEAIPVLYGHTIFVLDDLCILTALASSIPPPSLAAIRHLHVTWSDLEIHCGLPLLSTFDLYENATWDRFWRIVGTRMRLLSLHVDVVCTNPGGPDRELVRLGAGWVRPMLRVKGIRDPRVRLRCVSEERKEEFRGWEEEVRRVMMEDEDPNG